ncbi:MAG: hypothetical protein K6357_03945 [Elusimicrobiota bacterium]
MGINIAFILGGVLLFFISTFFSYFQVNPFYRLYYIFAWYSYIFFIDGTIYSLKDNSLIISRTKEFIYMLFVSTGLWFSFEIFNIFLKNWKYVMLPWDTKTRNIGYILSYATVLPAIFETTEFMETIGIFKKIKTKINIKFDNKIRQVCFYGGILLTILTLVFPKLLFPFIWISLLFIFEPLNYKIGTRSIIKELSGGNISKILSILLAGLLCGFIWELWNFKAGAKWIYTLPYLNSPRLFEMPIAGYLGFPFFALECYSIYNFLSYFKKGISWEEDALIELSIPGTNKYHFYGILITSVIVISTIAIYLIDKYTVVSYTIF